MYPRGGRVGSLALATHHRTSGSARTAPRQRCFDPAGAPFAFGRTWPPGRHQPGLAQNAGSIHDWVVRRVETAPPRGGQNGARPGYGAILHEECALDALKGGFWLLGRSVRTGGRAPAQGAHPSAGAALGVPNANLPVRWSLSTTPSPKPHVPQSVGLRAGCPRTVWYPIADGPPPAWVPRRGRRSPGIHSGLVRAVFVPIWARSRAVPTGLLWRGGNHRTPSDLSRTRAPRTISESVRAP
eukprot:scaffold1570_cov61-Phaeocystis_antarctica.AAC.4